MFIFTNHKMFVVIIIAILVSFVVCCLGKLSIFIRNHNNIYDNLSYDGILGVAVPTVPYGK